MTLPKWVEVTRQLVNNRYEHPNKQRQVRAVCDALAVAIEALEFLKEYTYIDAEGPELRAQNQRCFKMAKDALAEIERMGDDK